MGIEKKFVQDGLTKARINEYFTKQLERAGYGGMLMTRTPLGTQITLYAEKPGMVIGKGGKTIHRLTNDMIYVFSVDNPQIDVQEVKVPELNAQMMANRLANALERGWYFRKAGHNMLRRIMDAGALGCEIVISGKLTGPRSKVSKIVDGYIKHAGKPVEELVDTGFATAVKKLGTIGCYVRIVHPGTELPGKFYMIETEASVEPEVKEAKEGIKEVIEKAPEKEKTKMKNIRQVGSIWEHKHDDLDWHPMSVPHSIAVVSDAEKTTSTSDKAIDTEEVTQAVKVEEEEESVDKEEKTDMESVAETAHNTTVENTTSKSEVPEEERVREHNNVQEHKHDGYDYWHPLSRIHKIEGDDH